MGLAADAGRVLAALETAGIEHMLVGGVALEALGVPRATIDIDIQVLFPGPPPRDQSVLFECLVEEWGKDEVFGQETIIGHLGTSPVPIEFFLTAHWFTMQALKRRQLVQSELLGRLVPVPRPEDAILLKAAFAGAPRRTPGKRAQDLVDIEAIAQAAGTLDRTYLSQNAAKLGVSERVAALLRQ